MTSKRSRWSIRHKFLSGAISAIGIVLAAVVGLTFSASGRATNTVLWRGGFEVPPGAWGDWKVQAKPGGAEIETATRREGQYAAEFTVAPHDIPIGTSGERAQVYLPQSVTRGFNGEDVWYSWSTLIAHGSVLDPSDWNDLTAWHHTGPTCPAPVHFAINGKTRILRLDTWGGPLNARTCSNPHRRTWKLGTLRFGHWYDFVFHVKWSPSPAVGLVEVWVNGKRVVPPTHAATLYTGQGVYLKQGLDRGSAKGTAIVFNDGTRIAKDYSGAIAAFHHPAAWPSPAGSIIGLSTIRLLAETGLIAIVVLSSLVFTRHRRRTAEP